MSTVRLHHERGCDEMGVVMPEDDSSNKVRGTRALLKYLNEEEDPSYDLEAVHMSSVLERGRIAELFKNFSPRSREKDAA